MTKKIQLLLFLVSSIAFGQSFTGLTTDNYSGIHGVIVNPASVHNSPYRTDINLFSVSVLAGTDAFDIDFNKLISDSDYDLFDDESAKKFSENNNAYVNVDVLGPSFMFKASEKSSIAFTSRIRGMVNINELKGNLVDEIENIDEDFEDSFSVTEDKATTTFNSWAEIGFTYGREVFSNNRHNLNVGVTAKYLIGLGTGVADANNLTVSYNGTEGSEEFKASGNASYSVSEAYNVDEEEFDPGADGKGFGFDIGFVYELKKEKDNNTSGTCKACKRDYALKVGLAITDIGKVSYDGVRKEDYDFMNTTINRESFLTSNIFETVEDLTDPEITTEDLDIKLPTALRLNADFRALKRLYINAGMNQSLISKDEENANRIFSEYYVAPRFETKILTLGTTLMSRENLGFAWGANLRVGPLVIGSSTLFSGLFGDGSQQADAYLGLKIPVYRGSKEKKSKKEKK